MKKKILAFLSILTILNFTIIRFSRIFMFLTIQVSLVPDLIVFNVYFVKIS